MKLHQLLILSAGLIASSCTTSRHVCSPLQPPLATPSPGADLLIISATYGSGTHYVDVSERVNDLLRLPNVVFFSRPEWLHADPTPGWNKALVIVYEYKGKRHLFTTGEGGEVSVPDLLRAARK
jgi:hypothetical protein